MSVALFLAFALATPPLPPGAVDRLGKPALRHGSAVAAIAFSPDGTRLASGSNVNSGGVDPAVKVWDVATGVLVRRFAHDSTCVAWSADGRRVASTARDGTAKLWDLASGRLVVSVADKGGWATGVAVSPDGKLLASIRGNRVAVLIWDVATGKRVREFVPSNSGPKEYTQGLESVAFHPDGMSVAAGVINVGLVFWDLATGAEGRTIPGDYSVSRHEGGPIVFAADGDTVAVRAGGGVALHNPATGGQRHFTRGDPPGVRREGSPITQHALSSDGATLAFLRDGEFHLWDVPTDAPLRPDARTRRDVRGPLALSADGSRLAYAVGTGVALEDARTGRRLHAAGAHDGAVRHVQFGPAGEAWTLGPELRAWDLGPGGKRRGTLVEAAEGRPALALTRSESFPYAMSDPAGRHLVTVDTGTHTLTLWDPATGKRLRKFAGHNDPVDAVAISPDGTRMVTGGPWRQRIRRPREGYVEDTGLRVWDLDTGAELRQIPGRAGVICYSPDGKRLAVGNSTGTWEPTLRVLDAATGVAVWEAKGIAASHHCMGFGPDGKTLASAGRDTSVRLWDAATGKELRRLEGHEGEVFSLAFSADGKRLISGGEEGLAYIWDLTAPR